MGPRDDDGQEFELDDPDQSGGGEPYYRLPADLFTDPFEEGEEGGRKEVFLSSLLGPDEEAPAAPSLGQRSGAQAAAPSVPLRERLAQAVQSIGESGGERFAGTDVSAPSLLDRLRARRRSQEASTSAPAEIRSGEALAIDDPFARLLTPLAGPELARLRDEVVHEEVLFMRYERERASALQRQSLGVVFALVILTIFLIFAGRGYLHQELVTQNQPKWLADRVGRDRAGEILFILGLVLPFLTIGALADSFVHTMRALSSRSLSDFLLAILSSLFAASILLLLIHALPLQAALTLLVWVAFRFVLDLLLRLGRT